MRLKTQVAVACIILATLFSATPIAAADTAVQTVAGMHMLVLSPAGSNPSGSVLLIPGGTTRVNISANGDVSPGGNFLVRSRARFVSAGYVTAILDDPRDIAAAVQALHHIAAPVFVIGTSNGTIVAADAAGKLQASGAAGIIFTSTITSPGNTFSHGVNEGLLAKANLPLLFVHNTGDRCRASPLAPVETMATHLSGDVTFAKTTSSEISSAPCEASSPHGYLGIEAATVNTITAWMDAHH
jgi:hypothetical protein